VCGFDTSPYGIAPEAILFDEILEIDREAGRVLGTPRAS
jgi:hypothetical protein